MTEIAFLKAVLTYFALALIIFLSAYLFSPDAAIFLSIFLLIPILIWQQNRPEKEKLSKQVDGRNKGTILHWVFTLFFLALLIRIPSALLFGMPYEKTPLIFLTVFTIIVIEKTDVSAFGFKTQNIGKALSHGIVFYAILGGLTLLTSYFLVHVFTNQMPVQSYVIPFFVLAMPFHTLCVGLCEEGFFRGYVQTHLEKFYGASWAILIQAVLFGIWHFVWDLNPFDLWGMVQYMALAFLIGLPLGYFYSKARNLASVIIVHALWNSVQLGIIANPAASEALQSIPMATQILILLLPYAISVTAAILFTKLAVKEI